MGIKKLIRKILITIIILIILFLLPLSLYTVKPNGYGILVQFGKIVSVTDKPGLHFKLPFIQTTLKVTQQVLFYDMPKSNIITKDKKTMIADNYVLWKISDPRKYVQTLNANEFRAQERIEANVYNATKNIISSMNQDEIIQARNDTLSELITKESNSDIGNYGITIIDVQIKALDLPDDNKSAVYERMISERQNIAAQYTAEGNSEAQKIKNNTDREISIMIANAKKSADVLIAEGEAQYMSILKEAYNSEEKANFYNFIRALDALKKSLTGNDKVIILDKDSELVKILYEVK